MRKNISNDEYNRLWSEEGTRINYGYELGNKAVQVTLTYWGLIFASLGIVLSNIDRLASSILLTVLIGVSFLMFVPILIVGTYCYKYRENLSDILAIASYSLVFHELPSFLDEDYKYKAWELVKETDKYGDLKKVSKEINTICLLSTVFSVLLFITTIILSVKLENYPVLIVNASIYSLSLLLLIWYQINLKKVTDTKKMFSNDYLENIASYLTKSISIHYYSEDDVKNLFGVLYDALEIKFYYDTSEKKKIVKYKLEK